MPILGISEQSKRVKKSELEAGFIDQIAKAQSISCTLDKELKLSSAVDSLMTRLLANIWLST